MAEREPEAPTLNHTQLGGESQTSSAVAGKIGDSSLRRLPVKGAHSAFTLVEVMVALTLMAVVIPVVLQGMRVAGRAGEVAERKVLATRIAERVLNEAIISGQNQSGQSGSENAGPYQFRWQMKDEAWTQLGSLVSLNAPNGVNSSGLSQNIIHQFSVNVIFSAQGQDHTVQLSTLVNISKQ